jgi:hypothetical protein
MEKQNEPQQKVFVLSIINQKEKLQQELNKGYTVRYALLKGSSYIFILEKPEIIIRPPIQQPKEIESFRVLNPKNEDCQKEVISLQKKGFKIDSVTPTTAILFKYAKASTDKEVKQ